jgi:hypothetical protein
VQAFVNTCAANAAACASSLCNKACARKVSSEEARAHIQAMCPKGGKHTSQAVATSSQSRASSMAWREEIRTSSSSTFRRMRL